MSISTKEDEKKTVQKKYEIDESARRTSHKTRPFGSNKISNYLLVIICSFANPLNYISRQSC